MKEFGLRERKGLKEMKKIKSEELIYSGLNDVVRRLKQVEGPRFSFAGGPTRAHPLRIRRLVQARASRVRPGLDRLTAHLTRAFTRRLNGFETH